MAGPGSGGRPRQGPQPVPEVFRPVGLSGGIDTKTDYKLVAPPKTLQALNVRYGTAGSVRKRYGIAAMSSLTGAISVLSTQTELLACDSANMYAVNTTTGGLTNRGIVGAATLSSNNLVAIGTPPTQVIRTVQTDYLSSGGITYGLAVYEFGYVATTTGTLNANGMELGTTLYVVLFNATTNATVWATTVQGIAPSATYTPRIINSAGTVTFTTFSGGSAGACHPCITVYKNNFILTYIAASLGNTISDNGTSLSGCLYTVQSVTFTPSSTIPFSSSTSLNTNATMTTPMPAVIAGQPSSSSVAFAPALSIPLYYDIRTNGSDVLLFAAGQNYGAASGTTPVTYRAAGSLAQYTNAATFASPSLLAQSTTPPAAAGPVTLTPGTGIYGLSWAAQYYCQLLIPNYTATPTLSVGTAQSPGNPGAGAAFVTPFSNVFVPSSTLPTALYVYDGNLSVSLPISYSTPGNVATATMAAQFPVSAAAPDYSNAAPPSTGGLLASRLFLWNGAPVAWSIYSTVLRSTLNNLVLAVLNATNASGVTAPMPIAHAAYLRLYTPGVSIDLTVASPTTPYARQACNVSTTSVNAQPTISYVSNANPQENTISIRSLTVSPDMVGLSRPFVRTQQGVLYLGADPKYYDGNTCRSMGWEKIPEYNFQGNSGLVAASSLSNYTPSTSSSNAGLYYGGASTYTFFFVFVDYDAQGNVIYGSPSPAYSLGTVTLTQKTVLFIPSAMIPSRGYLQVYRNTVLNPLIYVKTKQFSQADIKNYGGIYVGVVDDTGTGSGGATETLSGGLLYSPPSGGEVANDPPPASSMGVSTKQRIFLVSQENPTWVYFSKPFYPGRAPEFAAGQFLDIDPTTGPITGIAALDTTIVVFKKGYIYSFGGDGPDATGNGSFTPTTQIASDTGCIDTPSVLTTEQGVWFRSTRGLQMLSRGGQVTYAAPEVEALLTNTQVISSALVPAQNQIRFSLSNGNVLVFDYLVQAWSLYVYFRPAAATNSAPTSFASLNNTLFFVNQAGDVCFDGVGFSDGTNSLPMTVQSAWISVAGAQGWGRIRRVSLLGDFRSAHTLTMSFSYDFASTPAYNIPYTASTTAQQNPYNWRVRAPRQVCQAVQITLTDSAPAGEGAVITGLVLELGPKSQALRVPDTQSV